MSVKLKIKNVYPNLSRINRRIADHILLDKDQFLEMSALAAAKSYQTSSASISRFAKTLGYKGLDELKIALAKDFSREEKNIEVDTIISKNDDVDSLCRKMEILVDNANRDLFEQLDKKMLSEAIDRLKQSSNIYLLGIGASMLPAYDMYHKLKRIHFKVHYEFDAHMAVEFFNYVTEKDCVVAFSYSGLTKEVLYPCEIAKKKGAAVIAVTRNAPSSLGSLADTILCIPENENLTRIGAIGSRFAAMEIVDLLYLGVVQKDNNFFEDRLIDTSLLVQKIKEEQ